MNKKDEIVTALNRRLGESAKFWYQCIDEYQDLNEFLSSLNALIQSLRNVTFIIQKHKDAVPCFDDWYSAKQDCMRDDQCMKWLKDARNEVVKRGDLKINSVAVATIKNWLDHELFEQQVDPLTSNDKIVELVLSKLQRDKVVLQFREPVLQIERIWIVDKLPGREILEVLAYCYNFIKSIVCDLYLQIGIDSPESVVHKEKDDTLGTGTVSRLSRIISIDIKDGSTLERRVIAHPISEDDAKVAIERYGRENIKGVKDTTDPFEALDVLVNMSKTLIVNDGYHTPMVHYFFEDGSPEFYGVPTEDKTQQYLLMRQLAEDIVTRQVSGFIFILEQWMYPLEAPEKRSECLMVACIRSDGKFESHITEFARNEESVILKPTMIETNLKNHNWLRPIIDAWGITL